MIEFVEEGFLWFLANARVLDVLIIAYGIIVGIAYLILCIFSILELRNYFARNSFVQYDHILASSITPSITIIAPAYNEHLSVVDNIRSLLTLKYPNFDIIVINDGSSDNTFEKIKEAFDLELKDVFYYQQIKTEKVRGIYKSKQAAFSNLTIIDKENGGKADALNAGLNIAESKYVSCVDVDSLLHPEALARLIKPFLETQGKHVLAAGGVLRLANSCEIKDGKLHKVNLPKSLLVKFQVIEYLRAFLLGRMAWTRFNGLLLISGAFGIFDREIAVKAGGYDKDTVGEDMELVMRMREYAQLNLKEKYKTIYIPDPLCWTEAPDKMKTLVRQRDRWTRGNIESLLKHKKMFMNPKYGLSNMYAYLYFLVVEWLAPIVEFLGFIYFISLIYFDRINWNWFWLLFVVVYSFMTMYSSLAILIEEFTFHTYRKKRDIIKLLITSWLEPFIYHPFQAFIAVRGNLHLIFGGKNKDWGDMEHGGFDEDHNDEPIKNETEANKK